MSFSEDLVKRPKKIAVLLPTLSMGGAETLVIEELTFLRKDPRFVFEVHVVFEGGPLNQALEEIGIATVVWGAPHRSLGTVIAYGKIIRYLVSNKFDILHNHLLDHIGPWIGKMSGLRVIATVHNDVRYNFWEQAALSRCDRVLACGRQVMDNIKAFVPHQNLQVLRNAIPLPKNVHCDTAGLMREIGINILANEKFILSIGRLSRQKGYDVLIDAFKQVVEKHPDVKLIIAGDGPDKQVLSAQICQNGLSEHIFLPGIVMRARDLLGACHLYVNSSRWEGLPMTLLEAMAYNCPIIATNVGGNGEVIRDRDTGLLVPPEQPEALSASIRELLEDQSLRTAVGANAFSLFRRLYTIDSHCSQLADEYLSV